jgi:hypothetical protein
MAEKRKVGGAAKKTVAADKQKEQSARFIKAARDVGVDETGREFEQSLRKMISNKSKK